MGEYCNIVIIWHFQKKCGTPSCQRFNKSDYQQVSVCYLFLCFMVELVWKSCEIVADILEENIWMAMQVMIYSWHIIVIIIVIVMKNLAHGDPNRFAVTWSKHWPGEEQESFYRQIMSNVQNLTKSCKCKETRKIRKIAVAILLNHLLLTCAPGSKDCLFCRPGSDTFVFFFLSFWNIFSLKSGLTYFSSFPAHSFPTQRRLNFQ